MGEKFEYKYSAPTIKEREEINSIRSQYLPKDEKISKIDRIKYLHKKVENTPSIISLSIGIVGSLLFGTAMTFFLEWTELFYIGIPFALAGIVLVVINYPLYKNILNKYKKKYGEEIIKLSNELLNDE